jgi:hypothetical protein
VRHCNPLPSISSRNSHGIPQLTQPESNIAQNPWQNLLCDRKNASCAVLSQSPGEGRFTRKLLNLRRHLGNAIPSASHELHNAGTLECINGFKNEVLREFQHLTMDVRVTSRHHAHWPTLDHQQSGDRLLKLRRSPRVGGPGGISHDCP